jgi:CheY-like chemotaxis protein
VVRVVYLNEQHRAEAAPNIILLVDDDLEILEIMSELLNERGYSTVQALNGQEALDLLKKMRDLPLLIVLDMSMPVLNGREFLRERGRDAIILAIPVIVVSGDPAPAILPMGSNAYLRKPVTIDRLIAAIELLSGS